MWGQQEGSPEAVAFLRLWRRSWGGHSRPREQPGVGEQLRTPKAAFRKAAWLSEVYTRLRQVEGNLRSFASLVPDKEVKGS